MQEITIGTLSKRTGTAISALRYYETLGILRPNRTHGGQRRYPRSDIRKVSFLIAAQNFGYSLPEIAEILAQLPADRAPNAKEWATVSRGFRARITSQIESLERMRDKLDGCIGCGCLSLESCALYNRDDAAGGDGPGPRFILEQAP